MCTRILWNTNPDLIVVGRNEDYVSMRLSTQPKVLAGLQGHIRSLKP